jgi:hypothetical protein
VKRALIALVILVPGGALAQPSGEPPVTLDPGGSGTQNPRPAAAEPAPVKRPSVVIVGPDGKVIGGDTQPAPGGYYVSGGGGEAQYAEPSEVHAGPTPELHVVRSGDTLWDICFYYFNDPWQWPKVWSYNPQITNPHWIYPGDLVRLLPRGMFAQKPDELEKGPDVAKPADPIPAPARRVEVGVKQIAFVEKSDLDNSITIDGAVDEKALLGDNDSVYLSYPPGKPPQVGQRYSIYVPGKAVKSGDKNYGSYVRILGTLEVVSVKQDKRARGVITVANQEIERGAKVGPLVKTFANVTPVAPAADVQAPIVAMLTRDQLIGQGEVVFIGAGKGSGIEVGNRMFVVRRGDARPPTMSNEVGKDDRRFPARALGEIVVVEVGDKVSIGLVTLSVQEMSVGDLVMMQKSK